VIVLSNNDGAIVALNKEAKKHGIKRFPPLLSGKGNHPPASGDLL